MQLYSTLVALLSLLSVAHLAAARPASGTHSHSARDINISHKSLSNGTVTSHHISSSVLPAELAKAIEGSDININLTTDRKKRSPSSGVSNSTINLTVIDARKRAVLKRAQAAAQHHNIHIDASSSGSGGVGGIHNSTVNINLNQSGGAKKRSRSARRKVNLGDHSVIVDVSTSGDNSTAAGGIEDSTVHVNILPARALNKATGHHSIVVDSSSLSSSDEASTTTGSHSAVVDTSSSTSSSTDGSSSTGVKNSTINLTVISPKDEPAVVDEVASPASDAVDAPAPTMAHLSARARAAYQEWASRMRERDYPAGSGFVQKRRSSSHASKRSTIVVDA
ncbi:hypothetical protein JCM3775_006002 [Rhodotorula graminis]|uniref:Uncharacterized protein n=1 Tax=Rhodotorula graminis (strain WP1) TaxID=578459 RepID=A0A194S9D0_RHOGW|nr:uncharacterized protein RHOBADRAFT_51212 [Rhodotorula graminis WP1]KPV77338.1 hypothetical protein RHOBADRAFT_51212 [Rhodotorula graminis WP1]